MPAAFNNPAVSKRNKNVKLNEKIAPRSSDSLSCFSMLLKGGGRNDCENALFLDSKPRRDLSPYCFQVALFHQTFDKVRRV